MSLDHTIHRVRARIGILPGFGLGMGITLAWLSLLVLIPLAALFIHAGGLGWEGLWAKLSTPRVIHAFQVTFGVSFAAALVNLVFGVLAAWVLVRYQFPGRRLMDALVDLPFALPTAVAGISLTALYAPNGWIGSAFAAEGIFGRHLVEDGWFATSAAGRAIEAVIGDVFTAEGLKIAFSQIGIGIALTFIGLPFVIRTVQPVLAELSRETEEAAACLGASRGRIITAVILPELLPAILTGFSLAFARAIGEYGSVVFISGSVPRETEIVPHLIIIRLEQYDYQGATALGAAMLVASFAMLLIVNLLQRWAERRAGSAL